MKPFPPSWPGQARFSNSGMALIVTLSLIVLVTVAAMAFFTRATSNTAVETSRSKQVLADQLLLTARDYLHGVFLKEIATNSTIASGLYLPMNPTNMVPSRLIGSYALTPAFTNLVRQSVDGGDPNASSDNTATAARNGRYISPNVWDAPMLTIPANSFTTSQTPCWIYLNKDGSASGTPSSNTVGRFAYNVYDVGGLLDANAAGYPTAMTPDNLVYCKGTLAGADLTNTSGLGISPSGVEALIRYRNPQAATPNNYTNYVPRAASNGFLSPVAGTYINNFFATRQDLISYATNQNTDLINALPYLTHFTRELARPSFTQNGFTNMTRRCDLSQVTNTANTANALAVFGLRSPAPATKFQYTYTNILSPIISTNTPDMFQVLRAGINFQTNPPNAWDTAGPIGVFDPASATWTNNMDVKALAIGANILEQFRQRDPSVPSVIRITNSAALVMLGKGGDGYISRIFLVCNDTVTGAAPNYKHTITFAVIPQIYNPSFVGIPIFKPTTGGYIFGTHQGITVTVTGPGIPLSSTNVPAAPVAGVANNNSPTISPNSVGLGYVNPAGPVPPNPVQRGFFSTTLPAITTTTPTLNATVTVSLTGLSFVYKRDSSYTQSVFSTNNLLGATGTMLNFRTTSAMLPSPLVLTLVSGAAIPLANNVSGLGIQMSDPRTLVDAGATISIPSTSISAAGTPFTTPLTPSTISYPAITIPGSISDTFFGPGYSNFPSVGMLGYVFRESPWRTIDFISGTNSPDRNLLDLFSAYPTPTNGIRAGVVNLNTRHSNVLTALLSGTPTTFTVSSVAPLYPSIITPIPPANASTFASKMVTFTSSTPLTNRSQLVDLVFSNIIADSGDTSKQSRETAVRALAEVGQTRTWNLMYDLVVQSGRFTGNSYTAPNFIVESEKHAWVHAAIDRPTAKVIDQQMEIVNP